MNPELHNEFVPKTAEKFFLNHHFALIDRNTAAPAVSHKQVFLKLADEHLNNSEVWVKLMVPKSRFVSSCPLIVCRVIRF